MVSGFDAEQANKTDLGNIQADEKLLESSWVDQSFSVDIEVVDKEDIVAVCEPEEPQSHTSKEKNHWCDASVADCYKHVSVQSLNVR